MRHGQQSGTQRDMSSGDGVSTSSVNVELSRDDISRKQQRADLILPEHVGSLDSDGDAYKPPVFEKSESSTKIIRKALDDSLVFSELDAEQKELVVASMAERRVAENELLIKQGDPGDAFYVVESGRFEILVNGHKEAEVDSGASFGELALIMNRPRFASVRATEPCLCWKIDRKPFRYFLASSSNLIIDDIYNDLKTVKVLEGLPSAHLYKLAAHATKEKFAQHDFIIRKGEEGDKFYMIKKGIVECRNIGDAKDAVVELAAGYHFGELALTHGQPRACDVVAMTDAECITLSKRDFEALLGSVTEAMEKTHVVNVVRGLPGFEKDWSRMYECLERRILPRDHVMTPDDHIFYQIQRGTVILRSGADGSTMKLDQNKYFGFEFLLDGSQPWWSTAVAETEVEAYALPKAKIDLRGGGDAVIPASQRSAIALASITSNFDSKYGRLKLGRTLGTGTFGRVKLATDPGNPANTYAVKLLVKKAMVDMNQAGSVELERRILLKLDHPFVLKCFATFQSRDECYFVLEFVQGGELFSRVDGGVIEKEAAFHSACVIDALEHIHANHILFRDLKPENVLLDAHGFDKIVDFGFAKHLPGGGKKTYTILGTPEYLSPECVLGKGYAFEVDLWAFGVLVYETLIGRSPFIATDPEDTMAIFRKIVAAKVKIPRRASQQAEHLVTSLLARDAKHRLGARLGAVGIKDHPFLEPYADYDALRRRKVKAPYIPNLRSNTDTSCFDTYPEDAPVKRYRENNEIFADFGPLVERPFTK